jgi:hypothetical protein
LNEARDGWRKRRLFLCGTVLRTWISRSSTRKKRLDFMRLLRRKLQS